MLRQMSKKDDFGNALQNLYRELERAEGLVGRGKTLPLTQPARNADSNGGAQDRSLLLLFLNRTKI